MKGAEALGVTVLVVLLFWYEWPKMAQNQKKEKAAFAVLTAIGWVLAILLLFFPEMLSPAGMLGKLFKPLGQMLERAKMNGT